MRRTHLASGVLFVSLLLRSAPALAGDEAAAEALFIEAKKLAAEGKLSQACPKFAESNRLDRGAGTLIHLADCYEKNKQTASAWATFKDAASAAQGLGRSDWEKLATQRAAALEPKLAKLTIKVQEPADNIEVTRDGSQTSHASWGTPIPVDLGVHVVKASAPGRKPFSTTITISKDGDRSEVTVPRLEVGSSAGGATTPAPPPVTTHPAGSDSGPSPRESSSQQTIGFVIGGIGVAGLAVGAVTGLLAIGKNNDSKAACPNDGACASQDAIDANDSAKTLGTISTIGFIAGAVGVTAGAILIFTAPKSSGHGAVRFVPASDGRSAGMTVLGSF